jgi:hypothetical protein
LGDTAHAIDYLAKLATFTVLATARTDSIVKGITGERMRVAFVELYRVIQEESALLWEMIE